MSSRQKERHSQFISPTNTETDSFPMECRHLNMDGHICTDCGKMCESDANQFVADVDFFDGRASSALAGGSATTVQFDELSSKAVEGFRIHEVFVTTASQFKLDDSLVESGKRIFTLAREKNILHGRQRECVVGACLYLACRLAAVSSQHVQPVAICLADISKGAQLNPTRLKSTYKVLAELWKATHTMAPSVIDPSIYVSRLAHQLPFGKKTFAVIDRTCTILTDMQRMCHGAHPIGISGAALFVAAREKGFTVIDNEDDTADDAVERPNPECNLGTIAELVLLTEEILKKHVQKYDAVHRGSSSSSNSSEKKRSAEEVKVARKERRRILTLQKKEAMYKRVRAQLENEGIVDSSGQHIQNSSTHAILDMAQLKALHVHLNQLKSRVASCTDGDQQAVIRTAYDRAASLMKAQWGLRQQSHARREAAVVTTTTLLTDDELDKDPDVESMILSTTEVEQKRKRWEAMNPDYDEEKQRTVKKTTHRPPKSPHPHLAQLRPSTMTSVPLPDEAAVKEPLGFGNASEMEYEVVVEEYIPTSTHTTTTAAVAQQPDTDEYAVAEEDDYYEGEYYEDEYQEEL